MDQIKRAVEEEIVNEREAKKLLLLLSSPQSDRSKQIYYPSLRFNFSPGGEISLPLDLANLDQSTIFRLLCGVVEPDLLKEDSFKGLLEELICDILKMSEKMSFSYESKGILYEISAEIIN